MKIPNDKTIPVNALREITLEKKLLLEHVLGVPKFCFNLLSISKLACDMNCTLTFWPNYFVIQDSTLRKLIGADRERDGLYYLDPV